jgi:hypothetical protein
MRHVFVRHIALPRVPRRDGRMGDAFDDLMSSVNFASSPSLSVPSSPTMFSSFDVPSLLTNTVPDISQSFPATSDSSWQNILTGVSKALQPLATAYGTIKTANAASSLASRAVAPVASAPSLPSPASLLSGSYAPYLIGGGLLLVALMSGGGGRRR